MNYCQRVPTGLGLPRLSWRRRLRVSGMRSVPAPVRWRRRSFLLKAGIGPVYTVDPWAEKRALAVALIEHPGPG